jgi:TDG/mug DNA glycosylase family protein
MEILFVRKSGLPPVVDENTEILILGTLPSDKSLAMEQYYANPTNDFWRLVGAALSQPFEDLSYEDKLALLKTNRIGLWDAFHACSRRGSMDKDMTEREPNDFTVLKSIAPSIRLICFNGKGAAEPEESLTPLGYETRLLPSSSAANRRDQAGRLNCWKAAIRRFRPRRRR